jgi:hypothetical protein
MAATGTDKQVAASDLQAYVIAELPTSAATPTAGVSLFTKNIGGRDMLATLDASGSDATLQPHIGRNAGVAWLPTGNSTTVTMQRCVALTATGTATASNVATTNLHTMMKRLDYLVTVAATTAVAGWRSTAPMWCLGNAALIGGFHYVCRWGPATGVATATTRAFVGFTVATAAPSDVEPSSLVSMVGMGWDAADTNIQMMNNNTTGTAVKTDLGASFPVPTADRASVYELAMFSASNSGVVEWQVKNLISGAEATGTISTELPATTSLLVPRGWMSVGGTSSVVGFALMGLYIETDN